MRSSRSRPVRKFQKAGTQSASVTNSASASVLIPGETRASMVLVPDRRDNAGTWYCPSPYHPSPGAPTGPPRNNAAHDGRAVCPERRSRGTRVPEAGGRREADQALGDRHTHVADAPGCERGEVRHQRAGLNSSPIDQPAAPASTRCAFSAIRHPPHLPHTARPLHESGTRRSNAQPSQRTSNPHRRKARKARRRR